MNKQKNIICCQPKKKKQTVPLVIGCILAIVTIVSALIIMIGYNLCLEEHAQNSSGVCWSPIGLVIFTLPLLIESMLFIGIGIMYFKRICKHPYWWLFLLNIILLLLICLFFAQR